MQKYFIGEHGEQKVKISNYCPRLREKGKILRDSWLLYHVVKVCCQYKGRINGEKFVKFTEEQFLNMFLKGKIKKSKLFLQDGDIKTAIYQGKQGGWCLI